MWPERQPRKSYPSDITDEQWAILAPLIPPSRAQRGGRPREVDMREVINTNLYQNRSGCQWDMLPHDLLPKSTVYDYFAQWRDDGTWSQMVATWRIDVKTRPEGAKGFTPLEKRWVVERTNAWNGRYRRNSQDYERKPASSAAMLHIRHIHLMLNRLAPRNCPTFHYRKAAA